jgi:hypothetical protein
MVTVECVFHHFQVVFMVNGSLVNLTDGVPNVNEPQPDQPVLPYRQQPDDGDLIGRFGARFESRLCRILLTSRV